MECYLRAFKGQWRVITEAVPVYDGDYEPHFACDLCHSRGSMPSLMDRIGNRDPMRESEFTHFEPYLCDPHARELGLVW